MMPKRYQPIHDENRMRSEGDVVGARADYATRSSANLDALLRSRFEWMNDYIADGARGVDVGCGAGLSANYIHARRLWLTDFAFQPFLAVAGVDALELPFVDGAFDFVVASNLLHHLPRPGRFLDEARRVVRRGGYLLMHEPQASVLFCAVLRAMRHEGYAFDVDVFDDNSISTDPNDLWAGNNAIPRLMFDDHGAFARAQAHWRIVRDEPCECLMFLNSGGVTAKTGYVPLPAALLRGMQRLDAVLAQLAPNVLALGRRIALQAL
jgi:SAM-dependent methyltransferase